MRRFASIVLAMLLCVAAPALAQAPQPGRLDVVIGYAYAQKPGERPAVAYQYDRIAVGQTLSTVTDSAVNLRLPEGVEVTLGSTAAMTLAAGEGGRTLLVLERGALRLHQTGPGRTALRVAGLDLVAEGADLTLVLSPGLSRINVRDGQVTGPGLTLGRRQTATLAPGAAPVVTAFPAIAYGQTGDRLLDQALLNGRGLQPPQQNMGFGR
jgi:hypothetical protein